MTEGAHPIRVRITVTGRVQGVFFRAGARDEAKRLGIGGFARNQRDGSVVIEAEGSGQAVEHFQEWCAVGPRKAEVETIEVSPIAVKGERDFVSG